MFKFLSKKNLAATGGSETDTGFPTANKLEPSPERSGGCWIKTVRLQCQI